MAVFVDDIRRPKSPRRKHLIVGDFIGSDEIVRNLVGIARS